MEPFEKRGGIDVDLSAKLQSISAFLWDTPFLVCIIALGIYLTVRSGFFSFVHFGHIWKHTMGSLLKKDKEAGARQKGTISPFEACCVAIGGCVGTANISGVAAAVAVGGPGSVFWMWLWAFFGMTVKCCEVALGSYYRSKNNKGEFFGGPSYYMEKGIAKRRGWKIGIFLAWMFGLCFFTQCILGSQPYAIAESLKTSFGIPEMVFVVFYSFLIFTVIFKGVSRVSKVATRIVPFMCVAYVLMGIVIIAVNYRNVPGVIVQIFESAFTGTAATGGFVGASVQMAIQKGMARAINSNEAGQGTSPMIHSSADTVHPVRQGLWGSMEVFIDTIIICSVTALSVLVTGEWSSGLTSVTLTTAAFSDVFGSLGVVFIGVMMFLFGITTTGGWYTYYVSLINHGFNNRPKVRDRIQSIFKCFFPLPPILFTASVIYFGGGANLMWDIVDVIIVLPLYFNMIAVLLLSNDYFKLLKDYKARWMGIGKVDPNFHYFYDTEPNEEAKAHDKELLSAQQ